AYAHRIWSIRLVGHIVEPGEKPLDTANRMLNTVFDLQKPANRMPDTVFDPRFDPPADTPIYLMQVNESDGTDAASPAYGCHDTSKASYSIMSPHWINFLCWWLRPQE